MLADMVRGSNPVNVILDEKHAHKLRRAPISPPYTWGPDIEGG